MRAPRHLVLLLAAALAAAALLATPAHANEAYDKVADAYARAGGNLDPCTFSEADLKAAVRGIPPNIRNVVPALRRAMVEGIAAHERGDCRGIKPEEGTTGGAAPGNAPTTTTPPVTTPPVTTQTAPAVPTAPTTTTPAPAAAQPTAASTTRERDRTPLVVALIALGALVLLALLVWGLALMRGWDPAWAARTRHGWGEAGYRTTSTWSEFTDWLRVGR
jgi:Spy/CpxP family protein refolding chaperone